MIAPEELEVPLKKILHRPATGHKYNFGHVLVIGGSPGMVGAPFLAARAALRIGAGLVTIASDPKVVDKLERRVEEIMTLRLDDQTKLQNFIKDRKVSVTVVGTGLQSETAAEMLGRVPKHLPLIIDGGGLGALHKKLDLLNQYKTIVLTPHAGEFQRLIGEPLPSERQALIEIAMAFSDRYGVTLVLKGHPTYVTNGHQIYQNTSGGPSLATAGTGDVLAGMIGGLVAQSLSALDAAKLAVYLHGLAGDLAGQAKTEPGVIASDIIELIPAALKRAGSVKSA